jgi:PAS domain S-box-containing protein
VGLWERDIERDEITASAKWRALFGLPPGGRLHLADVFARLHPEDEPRVRETIEKAAREGQSYGTEHRVVLPDGGVRWLYSVGRVVHGRSGQRGHGRGASMDITDRKRIESEVAQQRGQLAHLSRVASLGVLSGSLAHELNQPLGIILSNAQAAQRLLAREQPDLEEIRDILADIVSEDRRAGDVIKRLRALLQRGETHRQPVSVNDCLEEVLRLVRSDLVGRGVTVHCTLAAGLPAVMADHVQVQQVLLNLIVNACDAIEANSPEHRWLSLTTAADAKGVRVAVRDQGCGLPEDVEAMFEPFHSTKPHGLGMGLAICRTILTAHDGKIWAEPNPDRGATFHVSLPCV